MVQLDCQGAILGHESLNTTAIYTKRSQDGLQHGVEAMRHE
jgi:site-specific recombinase XerD